MWKVLYRPGQGLSLEETRGLVLQGPPAAEPSRARLAAAPHCPPRPGSHAQGHGVGSGWGEKTTIFTGSPWSQVPPPIPEGTAQVLLQGSSHQGGKGKRGHSYPTEKAPWIGGRSESVPQGVLLKAAKGSGGRWPRQSARSSCRAMPRLLGPSRTLRSRG